MIVTDEDRQQIRDAVRALPPMTDEQIDGICLVVVNAQKRWADQLRRTSRS